MTFICGPAKQYLRETHTHDRVAEITARCWGRSLPVAAPVPPPAPVAPVQPPEAAPVNVRSVSHGSWRDEPSTPAQWDYVRRLGGDHEAAQHMTKGLVSDWIERLQKLDTQVDQLASQKADEELVKLLQVIKDGYYAARETDESPVIFFKVSRPTKGNYKNAFKVMTQHSEKWQLAYCLWPSGRETVVRSDIKTLLLLVLANMDRARALYAFELNRCQICGKELTEDRSRYYGIGPECEKTHGHIIEDVEYKFGPWQMGKLRTSLD